MTVLFFFSAHCFACRIVKPVFKDVCASLEIPYEEVDTESERGETMCANYGVSSIPTMILLDEYGGELARRTGVVNKVALEEWFKAWK